MPDKTSLLSAINKAEQNSYGSDNNGDLSAIRARSIEDYLGEPYGDEVEGSSQVVSRDVFDTIESIKPSIMRIFTGGDRVCRFDPVGPEDEEQAEQESDYINHILQEKNDWFRIFYDWMSSALLTKNSYCMAYFDKSVDVEKEPYKGLTDEEMALLLQDPEVEPVAHSQYQGMGLEGPINLHDIEVQRTKHKGQVKLCVLPPERVKIDEDAPSFSVKGANYFEYWDYKTVSEIREMGIELTPEALMGNSSETGRDTPEDEARDNLGESRGDGAADPTMAKKKVRMVWIRHDYNGDGVAELLFCIVIGSDVPYVEEVSCIPVASIVPTPLPHRHIGLSLRDAVTDLQRINTVLWRQVLNNLYLANNGRYGISDKVNLDDMLVSRAGGVVRVNGVPSQEIFPFTHPFVAQHGIAMMEWVEQKRENRTGTNRYFTGTDQGSINKTASGIAQLTSAASQRVEMIARVIAEGVKELFLIVHELTIKHADASRQDKIRLRNQWVPIDPSSWRKRADLKIAVGLGTGNKEVMGMNLANIIELQSRTMPMGVAAPKHVYNALSEVVKNYGFANPEAFFMDPGDQPFNPPDPLQAEKMKAEIGAQVELQKEQIRQQAETQRHGMELQATGLMKGAEIKTEAKIEAMKVRAESEREVIRSTREFEGGERAVGEAQAGEIRTLTDVANATHIKQLADIARSVAETVNGVAGALKESGTREAMMAILMGMQEMIAASKAPKEVVRDKSGQIVGVRVLQ